MDATVQNTTVGALAGSSPRTVSLVHPLVSVSSCCGVVQVDRRRTFCQLVHSNTVNTRRDGCGRTCSQSGLCYILSVQLLPGVSATKDSVKLVVG